MHTDRPRAVELARGIASEVTGPAPVEVAVCPPFVSLEAVSDALQGTPIGLGAQNMHFEDEGAYTGEVSAPMLRSVGCEYVILGHSERRQYFGEEDAMINEKARQARRHELVPIVCVGETQEQRQAGQQEEVVLSQVEAALFEVEVEAPDALVLAYEPVWAIGTGESATPEQAQDMHAVIREWLRDRFDEHTAQGIEILYGGSMKPHNAAELLTQPDVDGGLIGSASLKADDFAGIVEEAKEVA